MSDKQEVYLKFNRALTTLKEVSNLLKSKIEHFNDDQMKSVKEVCENWGKNWPDDFPHLNFTPRPQEDITWCRFYQKC